MAFVRDARGKDCEAAGDLARDSPVGEMVMSAFTAL